MKNFIFPFQDGLKIWPYLALITAVLAAYANVYDNHFLYDDLGLIIENTFLKDWENLFKAFTTSLRAGNYAEGHYYRPLQQSAYIAIYQFFGLSTVAFHALNISLHTMNACLMFTLGRRMNFSLPAVFAASLLWALHPVHTEAVTYMSATADPLHTFFCMLGLLVLLPDFSTRRIVIACICFIGALFSKEGAIVFPFLAASLIYITHEKRLEWRSYITLWPLIVVALIYLLMRSQIIFIPAQSDVVSAVSPTGFAPLANLTHYLQLLIYPAPLYMKHVINTAQDYWWIRAGVGFAIASSALLLIVKPQITITLPISWGMLWFACAMIPAMAMGDVVYEHWLYLPSIGLFLGAAQWASRHAKKLVMLAPVLGFLTFQQNTVWQDTPRFFNHILAQGHPAPEAHINLGMYYTLEKKYVQAIQEYDAAIKDYARTTDTVSSDNRAALENNIAMTVMQMGGADDKVLAHLFKALEYNPHSYKALNNLAYFYKSKGDEANAKLYQEKADSIAARF